MIILVTIDGNNTELKLPLSCDATTTLRTVITLLRAKLRAPGSVSVDIRTTQGLPIALTETMATLKERQKKAHVELYALLDGPRKAVQQCLLATTSCRKQENPTVSDEFSSGIEEDGGGSGNDNGADDTECLRPDDPRLPVSTTVPGLHFIKINGIFQKAYALQGVHWGAPITAEIPILSLVYSTQIAEAVLSNEKLRRKKFDPNFTAGESPIRGVDNETFSKCVSIGKTYGHLIKTKDKYGAQYALYPEISCIRHSCSPNSVFRRTSMRPFRGVVRCATPGGLLAGDEVTVLLPKVNTLVFMLLPCERRQKLLQERYHFTCDCARCWKESSERELSLTGAFFNGEAEENTVLQKKLSTEMRSAFDGMNIFCASSNTSPVDTPPGAKIPKNPVEILNFIFKYTTDDAPLRLHKNHWRISVARIAYLRQADFVLSVQSKPIPVRPFLEQRSFDVALQQLATETLFIPKGHPFFNDTYKTYRKMMSALPGNLCGALQARSRRFPIDWDAINAGHHLWEGRVTALPQPRSQKNPNETSSDEDADGDREDSDDENSASPAETAKGSAGGEAQ